jgi:3-hydroxyacyl-CoA dehydrogenase
LSEVEASMALEENRKVLGMLHGLLGVNDYTVCDPAKKYREQVKDQLRSENMTDVPELMAAASKSGNDLLLENFDPLGQVE